VKENVQIENVNPARESPDTYQAQQIHQLVWSRNSRSDRWEDSKMYTIKVLDLSVNCKRIDLQLKLTTKRLFLMQQQINWDIHWFTPNFGRMYISGMHREFQALRICCCMYDST